MTEINRTMYDQYPDESLSLEDVVRLDDNNINALLRSFGYEPSLDVYGNIFDAIVFLREQNKLRPDEYRYVDDQDFKQFLKTDYTDLVNYARDKVGLDTSNLPQTADDVQKIQLIKAIIDAFTSSSYAPSEETIVQTSPRLQTTVQPISVTSPRSPRSPRSLPTRAVSGVSPRSQRSLPTSLTGITPLTHPRSPQGEGSLRRSPSRVGSPLTPRREGASPRVGSPLTPRREGASPPRSVTFGDRRFEGYPATPVEVRQVQAGITRDGPDYSETASLSPPRIVSSRPGTSPPRGTTGGMVSPVSLPRPGGAISAGRPIQVSTSYEQPTYVQPEQRSVIASAIQPMAQPAYAQPGRQPMIQPMAQPGRQPMAQPAYVQTGRQPMVQPAYVQTGRQPIQSAAMVSPRQPGRNEIPSAVNKIPGRHAGGLGYYTFNNNLFLCGGKTRDYAGHLVDVPGAQSDGSLCWTFPLSAESQVTNLYYAILNGELTKSRLTGTAASPRLQGRAASPRRQGTVVSPGRGRGAKYDKTPLPRDIQGLRFEGGLGIVRSNLDPNHVYMCGSGIKREQRLAGSIPGAAKTEPFMCFSYPIERENEVIRVAQEIKNSIAAKDQRKGTSPRAGVGRGRGRPAGGRQPSQGFVVSPRRNGGRSPRTNVSQVSYPGTQQAIVRPMGIQTESVGQSNVVRPMQSIGQNNVVSPMQPIGQRNVVRPMQSVGQSNAVRPIRQMTQGIEPRSTIRLARSTVGGLSP